MKRRIAILSVVAFITGVALVCAVYGWKRFRSPMVMLAIENDDLRLLAWIYWKPVKIYDKWGASPLSNALLGKHVAVVRYLLSIGVNPDEPDELGYNAVELAVESRECLKAVLRAGASVDRVNPITGFTPLLVESANANGIGTLDTLLDAGANPNYKSPEGLTPLMRACGEGRNLQGVKLLLKYGASLEAVDKEGKSVYDYAKRSKSKPLIDYLESLRRERDGGQ